MLLNSLSSVPSFQVNSFASSSSKQSPVNNEDQQDSSSNATDPEREEKTTQVSVSEQQVLQKLKNRDREVRAHEQAHVSAGGRYASGAHFSYQKGPDGKLYAVGGEVSIDTSEIPGDPKATLLKAQVIARAALAPANPSAQDRNVAAQATAVIQQARVALAALLADSSPEDVGQNLDAFA